MSRRVAIVLPLLLALFLSLAAAAVAAAGDDAPESYPLTKQGVEDALADLTSGDRYKYDESVLDDPAWLLRLREWFDGLIRRLIGGPSPAVGIGGFRMISTIIIAALLTLMGVLLLMRIGWSPARQGAGADSGVFDVNGLGSWSDADVRKATELASAGLFREAVSTLFRSALKGLGDLGWIRYRSSGGSRSYLRQLRRSADIYPLFRDLLGRFEVAYYRKVTPDEDDWSFMFGAYENLARAAVVNPPPSHSERR